MKQIAIIGAGAAGMMAASVAGENPNLRITVFERNPVCGKKLRITGKGRCNLTNTASVQEMLEMIPRGGKFLLTALYHFPPQSVWEWMERRGVPLKEERGGRVFPVSDRAQDVVDAMVADLEKKENVTVVNRRITGVRKTEEGFTVFTQSEAFSFDAVLIATGGVSYPVTGSTGDGYRFAEKLGLSITPARPALCPLTVKEAVCREAMGLSLKNCAVKILDRRNKTVYEDFGELLFTHFGLSGPVILSASSYLNFPEESYRLILDLKPALTPEVLDRRILSDLKENSNKDLINALDRLLPQKIISPVIQAAGLSPRKKVHLITREERGELLSAIKEFPLTVTGTRPIQEAIVTRGGISLQEINPRTMESKKVPGLYFAGEVLDADALTGGFNLQIALSTGHLAGETLSKEAL